MTATPTALAEVANVVLADNEIERALVVTAHPDDVDFGAGGTIAAWTKAGIEVSYCICTNGDAGGFDLDFPREHMAPTRQAEQRAAGDVLGVKDVFFLGHPDGRLTASFELRRDISRVIRQVRPQRLLCQSPERHWQRIGPSHPDHMAAGEAALAAVYPDARNPFAHPELWQEGLRDWKVAETWVMGREHNNHYVDVTDTFELKKAALMRHESQLVEIADLDGMLRHWLTQQAMEGGLPAGRVAEAFYVFATV